MAEVIIPTEDYKTLQQIFMVPLGKGHFCPLVLAGKIFSRNNNNNRIVYFTWLFPCINFSFFPLLKYFLRSSG